MSTAVNYGIFTPEIETGDAQDIMNASAIYGEAIIGTTAQLVFGAPDVWVEFTGSIFTPTAQPKSVTITDNMIFIKHTGRYKILLTGVLQHAAGAVVTRELQIGFGIDGADPTGGVLGLTTLGPFTPTTATGVCIIDLDSGDILSLFGKNVTDTTGFGIVGGSFSVELIDIA